MCIAMRRACSPACGSPASVSFAKVEEVASEVQGLPWRLATFAGPREFVCRAQGIAQRLGDFDEFEQRVVVGHSANVSRPPECEQPLSRIMRPCGPAPRHPIMSCRRVRIARL